MLSLESTSSRMNRLAPAGDALRLVHCRWTRCSPRSTGVRPEEVEALIHRVLDEEQLSLLALGPVERGEPPARAARA